MAASRGFTYVWVLGILAIVSLGLAAVGQAWGDRLQREREQELLRIGALYAKALTRYRAMSPGSTKQFPRDLGALLEDTRFVGTQRHLRQLYADPLNPQGGWGLVRAADGQILGVYSRSTAAPLRRAALVLDTGTLPAAGRYEDWKFMAKVDS